MKINRSGLVILCMVLVVALCGTVLGFAQGGALIPGMSGEAPSEAEPGPEVPPLPDIPQKGEEDAELTLGASALLQLTDIGLDKKEIPTGGKLELTLGLSGCEIGTAYQAQATFIGLAEGEELTAFGSLSALDESISLQMRLSVDGPADT